MKLGQSVAQGDLIAQVAATQARQPQSLHDQEREEELLISDFTSSENVETAHLSVQVYEADLQTFKAELASADVSV